MNWYDIVYEPVIYSSPLILWFVLQSLVPLKLLQEVAQIIQTDRLPITFPILDESWEGLDE